MAKNRDSILIARFSALGDVAMTLPVVYNACTANPDKRFYYLTRKHPARLFINKPDNLTVLGIDTDDYKGAQGMFRLARELRRDYDIQLFLDLHNVLRTRLLAVAFGIAGIRTVTVRKGRKSKEALTRRLHKVVVQIKPMSERYRDVFYKAGIALSNDFKSVFGGGRGDIAAFASVTPPKQPGEKWLAVAPFAKHKGKIYPLELLDKVIGHYAAMPEWKIFILGFGSEEERKIEELAKGRPNVVNMARAGLGMAAELSLMSWCDVMLSMDSANMHLASLVGLRAVTVWGATHPYAGFLGWRQHTSDVVQLDMICRPCSVFGDRPCHRGDYHCLYGIPPQLIINKIGE